MPTSTMFGVNTHVLSFDGYIFLNPPQCDPGRWLSPGNIDSHTAKADEAARNPMLEAFPSCSIRPQDRLRITLA